MLKSVHKLIKKVTEDIEKFSYNTSISAFMIAVSELSQQKCHNRTLLNQLTVSCNGKARFQKKFAADAKNDEIQAAVLADEQSQKYLEGKTVVKVIVVPKKIVNIVIK